MRTSHPLLGHELGGYTLESVLGSGGMGTVFEARDGEGQLSALKLLHPGFSHDEEVRRRLRREVATLHRVRGAGVAQVIDAELEGDQAFIVTELIEGDTLEASVAGMGPMSAGELSEFAVGMAVALGSIHAVGVIHRDLKPSNVMLTEKGPVLIDFGISQATDDARITSTGLVTGTPGYVDPAVVSGADVTIAADWWGWAAVLVFAATGRAPFGTGPWPAVFARVNQGEPDLEGISEAIAAPLRAALHPDPQERMLPATVLEHLENAASAHDAPTIVAPDIAHKSDESEPMVMPPSFEPARQQGIAGIPATRKIGMPEEVHAPPEPYVPPEVPAQGDPRAQLYPAPSAPGQWWALESGQSPQWAQRPASRPGIAFAWWLAAVALAIVWPGAVLVGCAVILLLMGMVGLNRRSLRNRRWRRGVTRADRLMTLLKLPWHIIQAVLLNLPGALLGVASGAILWLLVDIPEYQGVIAAGSVAILLLMVWCIPSAAVVREGAWHTLKVAAKPGWEITWIVIPIVLVIMGMLLGMNENWQEVWEPLPIPPRLS